MILSILFVLASLAVVSPARVAATMAGRRSLPMKAIRLLGRRAVAREFEKGLAALEEAAEAPSPSPRSTPP